MDLIKVEPDDSSVSDVRDEEECEIPFIKTEAREIDFDWERKSETAHDGKKPGSVGDAATNTKEDEDKKAVDCHEMKSEVKEESITVEEWNDDTKALASETQLDRWYRFFEEGCRRSTFWPTIDCCNTTECKRHRDGNHSPYRPDFAPSNFHLFGPMKKFLEGKRFCSDEEVKSVAHR
ncbi:uncharacterized protein [Periplaneta americana]|uniref:uncharacterized protein isoform X3 n=1 Tax=Periplaneta americana TaxID=6978 RepID=UPI0037E8873B